MKYIIVEHDHKQEMEKLVNQYIKEGWMPSGGVSLMFKPQAGYGYLQAMIKYERGDKR